MTTDWIPVAIAAAFLPLDLFAQETAFTYQGRLQDGRGAANGIYEMTFALHDAETDGALVSAPTTIAPLAVSNGLFTATLDFGAGAFTGLNRWLEITVAVFGSAQPPVTLEPRQLITGAPWALHAGTAASLASAAETPLELRAAGVPALRLEGNDTSPNIVGGSVGNMVWPRVVGAVIAGGGALDYFGERFINTVTADFGVVGGGILNSSEGKTSTIAGGYANTSSGYASAVGGGFGNFAVGFASTTAGGGGNESFGDYAAIVGGSGNSGSGRYSTVGGGYSNGSSGDSSAVLGGQRNQSHGSYSTIAGGASNTNEEQYCTIGGGSENIASSSWATVGGGYSNRSSGFAATIGGGQQNACSGHHAAVPGGFMNEAGGHYSFAAGYRAKAFHSGSFVWADQKAFDFFSANSGEFAVRATGGVRFVTAVETNGSNIAGVALAPGSGSWSSLSDRNAKENFAVASPREILNRVAALPVGSWNYKAQGADVRHLGPTAQDFRAAFGLGENDHTISSVDADGVALAAIQGLNQKLEETRAELNRRDAENLEMKRTIAELKAIVEKLAQTQVSPGFWSGETTVPGLVRR